MIIAASHPKENERLLELASYSIMDTIEEEDYDNLTSIAAAICGTSISLVSLVDDKRQWFKSHHGLDVSETHRDFAFCAHAIFEPDTFFEISDARKDERFSDNPLVTGEPHIAFYAGVPLFGENELPLGTLCVIDSAPHQLTEHQKKSLHALSKQVMNLIKLRRSNIQLQHSIQNLEEINQNLERFAMVAAHDLKSPLNNISGLTDLFKNRYRTTLDEKGIELLDMISNSSFKLKGLIDGLLLYSRSDTFSKEDKSTVVLKDLFDEILTLTSQSDSFEFALNTTLTEINANKTVLYHVMLNLFTNAIKYNNNGSPKISVSVKEDNQQYAFEVMDNGPGIPKEFHTKIFEMFRVLQSTDRSGEAGNGIGLAMVKKLIQDSGGNISIESELREGTLFKFWLPK